MNFNEIVEYQIIKRRFTDILFTELRRIISNMSINSQIGLKREYRAFKYLQTKYSSYEIIIPDIEVDTKQGIDLIVTKGKVIRTFQVTGPSEISNKSYIGDAEYLLIVSDSRIYQKKVHLTP